MTPTHRAPGYRCWYLAAGKLCVESGFGFARWSFHQRPSGTETPFMRRLRRTNGAVEVGRETARLFFEYERSRRAGHEARR